MSNANFEGDEAKNLENQQKHGVTFHEAQHAFLDENRVIAEKLSHSQEEKRFYCFGEKERRFMNKVIQYSDEPLGEIKLISDFLPSPEELSLKNQNTKVTIYLSSESVAYFKNAAQKHHMQYQKMIRQLLDEYVAHQKSANK